MKINSWLSALLVLATSSIFFASCKDSDDNGSGDPRYRRMLFILEACHSGHIINRMPKMDNVLYLAAAEDENSWSDSKNCITVEGYGKIFLFDDFSNNLVQTLRKNPNISLYSLYTNLYDSTTGSHPTIFNTVNYGNLFNLTFAPDF